jgi:sensor domain CHASE-containing protein
MRKLRLTHQRINSFQDLLALVVFVIIVVVMGVFVDQVFIRDGEC